MEPFHTSSHFGHGRSSRDFLQNGSSASSDMNSAPGLQQHSYVDSSLSQTRSMNHTSHFAVDGTKHSVSFPNRHQLEALSDTSNFPPFYSNPNGAASKRHVQNGYSQYNQHHSASDLQAVSRDQADSYNARFMGQQVGGTTYFLPDGAMAPFTQTSADSSQKHNHRRHVRPDRSGSRSLFIDSDVRKEALDKLSCLNISAAESHLPAEVDHYKDLWPLEDHAAVTDTLVHEPCSVYRVTSIDDQLKYCLRRVHGIRLISKECEAIVDQYRRINHPSLARLHRVFHTNAFDEPSLCFVTDYHPCAMTLHNFIVAGHHLPSGSMHGALPPEQHMWMYLVQLASALRALHTNGLSARSMHTSKILVDKNRVWLGGCGLLDIVNFDPTKASARCAQIRLHQRDDLTKLGEVLLSIACSSPVQLPRDRLPHALSKLQHAYSPDLHCLISFLLSDESKTVNDIMPQIGARFYTQLDNITRRSDVLENELIKEVTNGRLFRLQVKLTSILERPDFHNRGWNETSEMYLLKLFRDYVYHMVDENGRPWMDMSHVVTCLNKLDAGSEELINLMSSDSQTVLVVSYKELQNCMDKTFSALCRS